MMRLLVSGSRKITLSKWERIWQKIRSLNPSVIIHGGAIGVDKIANGYAHKNKMPVIVRKPDYEKYGRRAPIVRNQEMVHLADTVLIVYEKTITAGTATTLKMARTRGKIVHILDLNQEEQVIQVNMFEK